MQAKAFITTIMGRATALWPFIIKTIASPNMDTGIINMTKGITGKTITNPTRWIMG